MKLKHIGLVVVAGTFGISAVSARTWTSADGSKTFEGDFRSWDEKAQTVTVTMATGRVVTFDIDKLSDGDQEFLKEQQPAAGDAAAEGAALEAFSETELGKALRKLEILEGKRFQKHELAKAPEYFILYYSASW